MKNPLGGGNGMVPHYSGTTLDAQARYAKGTRSILENYLADTPQEPQNIIIGLGMYNLLKSGLCLTIGFSAGKYETKACKFLTLLLILQSLISLRFRWPTLSFDIVSWDSGFRVTYWTCFNV